MPFRIRDAAVLLNMDLRYLSTYCCQRNIGTIDGRDRVLSDADIMRIRNRPKRGVRGPSKKTLEISRSHA